MVHCVLPLNVVAAAAATTAYY